MIKEALLRRMEDLGDGDAHWSRSAAYETGLATLAQWADCATCLGFTVAPAPGLDGRVLSQDGGLPFRITDPCAVPGHDVFCVLVWEKDAGPEQKEFNPAPVNGAG